MKRNTFECIFTGRQHLKSVDAMTCRLLKMGSHIRSSVECSEDKKIKTGFQLDDEHLSVNKLSCARADGLLM